MREDEDTQKCRMNYSIPPIPEDNLRLWLQTAPKISTISMEEDDDISNYFHSQKSNSRLEDEILHGFDSTAQSSNNTHTRKAHEAIEQNGCDAAVREKCKRQKRPRSTQDHNLSERLRRKKLTEKMTALQEMIPNSVKRDQASTIDDAIKYIKTLQCQLQMMSAEAAHTLLHSPVVMVPHLGQRGIQIPNLAPPLATGGNGACLGMTTLLPSVAYPIGLTNPWLAQSPAIGPGLATAHHSIQSSPAQLLDPIYADDNIPCFVSQLPIAANREAFPSQDVIRRLSRYS